MPIWGRRDSEPSAEEAHESRAGAQDTQEPAVREPAAQDAREPAGEHQAEETAPAFWRAQGRTEGSPAPASAGADRPAVLDEEPAVKDPALTGRGADAGPAVTEVQEPTVAVAHEPVVNEGQETAAPEPAATGAQDTAAGAQDPVAGAREPVAGEPVMAEAKELAGAGAQGPTAAEAQEPAVTAARADAHDPGISAQRWREILVAFVDDPRGSVNMAADAVDEAIDEFVNSIRDRQRALSSSWQDPQAGTEQFRTAVRDYRTLWHQVRQLDLGEKKTGG